MHRKIGILVLFCATSVHQINKSSHFYVNRHVYYTSNQKVFLCLCKACSSWYFYKRAMWKQQMFTIHQIKNSSFYLESVFLYISIKKIEKFFSEKVLTIIVYKGNLNCICSFFKVWHTLCIYLLLKLWIVYLL